MRTSKLLPVLLSLVLISCERGGAQGPAHASPQPGWNNDVVRAEPVAQGLSHPWGFEFLPDGRIIVTERDGNVRIVGRDGRPSTEHTSAYSVHESVMCVMQAVAFD